MQQRVTPSQLRRAPTITICYLDLNTSFHCLLRQPTPISCSSTLEFIAAARYSVSRTFTPATDAWMGSEVNGISSSVRIPTSPEDDPSTVVAFSENPTCSVAELSASGNVGCLAVGAGRNNFQSISVLGGQNMPPPKKCQKSGSIVQHGDFFEQEWTRLALEANCPACFYKCSDC